MTEDVLDTVAVSVVPDPVTVVGRVVPTSGWPDWAITDPDVIAGIAERVQWWGSRWFLRRGPRPVEPDKPTFRPPYPVGEQ